VWFWFGDCPNSKMMGMQVLLEGKSIYHSGFRACQLERTDANSKSEGKIMAFSFSGGHTFQASYRTSKSETIEVNIWQAGADPDGIVLGISFMARNQILLNTIHIAKPGESTESTLDRALVFKTYPEK
jgi:hypothetical protein